MSQVTSVALCTYNGAAFIQEQIRSILQQTLVPDEIVISDDGSSDGTLDLVADTIEEFQAENRACAVMPRILRNAEPLGVTRNFEQALTACNGDLIALSDQDDLWHPQRFERMVAEFGRRPNLLLLSSDARLVDAKGKPTGLTLLATLGVSRSDEDSVHQGRALDALLRRNIVTGATTMVRRNLVERAVPFPESWVHDEWLAMVGAVTGEVDLLAEALIDYRQHGGNQIGASSLDAAGKLGRLRAPRSARNRRLLARAEALQERARDFRPVVSPGTLAKIDAKVAHDQMRNMLPAARLLRVRPILQEWRTGAYNRYGLGLQDVLRDLVQPV
ncbi:glycosyltransferase family 2 protein [Glaciibacter sp. 2TAF33]|uniref:glycosyltransferase family 2 protein n=1 Tax=Glaciibacter sp. 2TAF33 TaxID=3233015 RepID=UPI003F8F4306